MTSGMTDIAELFRRISGQTGAPVPVTHLIVGLGNPGRDYEGTRHNAGFRAIDALAADAGLKIDRLRFRALTCEGKIGETRALLMKPQTFMNNSGEAVREAADFYKIPHERILVLCDDVSFDPGRMRLRLQGSCGGHNGLRSIIECLGDETFTRLRIGVGKKPRPDYDLADWVLGHLSPAELAGTAERMPALIGAVKALLAGKTEEAQLLLSLPAKEAPKAERNPEPPLKSPETPPLSENPRR